MKKENVVYKKCHAELVSASSTLAVSQVQRPQHAWKTLKCGAHPRQVQGDSMINNAASGFTLIELLVVVLIIGILAAVALPQYQQSVEKSRATEAISLLRTITNSQERYYLENNQYTNDLSNLDIGVPAQTQYYNYSCNGESCFAAPRINGNYFFWAVMNHVTSESLADNSAGKHWCVTQGDNRTLGRRFCRTLGKQDISEDYYLIN